jgi:hypothetical protein
MGIDGDEGIVAKRTGENVEGSELVVYKTTGFGIGWMPKFELGILGFWVAPYLSAYYFPDILKKPVYATEEAVMAGITIFDVSVEVGAGYENWYSRGANMPALHYGLTKYLAKPVLGIINHGFLTYSNIFINGYTERVSVFRAGWGIQF